jgi:hypothetical protein
MGKLNAERAGCRAMLPGIFLCLTVALSLLAGDTFAGDPSIGSQPQKLVHNWENITYPFPENVPSFIVGYAHQTESSQGFRFDILNIPRTFVFSKTNVITARLYRANGEIVRPTPLGEKLLNMPTSMSTASVRGMEPPLQVMTYFPWVPNTLEECWIEASIGAERYWVEVPYGYYRKPDAALPPQVSSGPPKFVPAMKSLTAHDHVIPWANVQYDLGEIQNGWRLMLTQSNPSGADHAETDVVLYCERGWDQSGPDTSLQIIDSAESIPNKGSSMKTSHDDGNMEIHHIYDTDTRNLPAGTRGWGELTITVGDKTWRAIVPSSIYKPGHGHASQ